MKNSNVTIKISEISFQSTDSHVLIKGEVRENHLRFNSELMLPMHGLNRVLNDLDKVNTSNSDISFETLPIFGTESNYYFWKNQSDELSEITVNYNSEIQNVRQIRA